MHHGHSYLSSSVYSSATTASIPHTPLTKPQATILNDKLEIDARNYLYSSTITLTDAIGGIQKKSYTWAMVQAYYSTFYSLRSILASNGTCIFYFNQKPYHVKGKAGATAFKGAGTTHKFVINCFENEFAGCEILSQDIDSQPPLSWLMEIRESANYKCGKFCEPSLPRCLVKPVEYGIHKAVIEYANDTDHTHTFDPDHAILAFPLKALQMANDHLRGASRIASEEEIAYFQHITSSQRVYPAISFKLLS